MYVLGIDGGGTRTSGVVADETGEVYMQAFGGGSNPTVVTKKEYEEIVSTLVAQLEQQNPVIFSQLEICFAGMSGFDESGQGDEFTELLESLLPAGTTVVVKNDAYNALYSGTLGNPGIVQVAGTGSITFGINYEDKAIRSGGWGYLFDEAGSGFYMGQEALRKVFEHYDGRGPATSMTEKILHHFGASQVADLTGEVFGSDHPRTVIAKLSPIVITEAEAGDPVAKAIFCKACEEMIKCIEACHSELFEQDHPTVIVLAGGVFTNPRQFLWYLNELSKESLPKAVFRESRFAPVGGAIIGGLKAMGINSISETFAEQMNQQLER